MTLRLLSPFRLLVLMLVAALLLPLLTLSSARAESVTVASDGFSRQTSNGWGRADAGGAWQVTGPWSNYRTHDGLGFITLPQARSGRDALLPSVPVRDVDLRARFDTNKAPTGYGQMLSIVARHTGHLREYRARLRNAPDGVYLSVNRINGDVHETFIGEEVRLTNLSPGGDDASVAADDQAALQAAQEMTTEAGFLPEAEQVDESDVEADVVLEVPGASPESADDLPVELEPTYVTPEGGTISFEEVFGLDSDPAVDEEPAADAIAPEALLEQQPGPELAASQQAPVVDPPADQLQAVVEGADVPDAADVDGTITEFAALADDDDGDLDAAFVRATFTGANPTTIRVKAWRAGSSEPSGWALTATDSTSALQGNGSTGVRTALTSSTTNAPVVTTVDSFQAVALSAPTASSPAPSTGSVQGSSALLPSTSYTIPSAARFVSTSGSDRNSGSQSFPWRTIGHAVQAASSGTTIVLRGGTYREDAEWYGKRLTLQPYPGEQAWMSGSVVVDDWDRDGDDWRLDNWTTEFNSGGLSSSFIDSSRNSMAGQPDQVFIDGAPLWQVGSRLSVRPGTFYVDDGNNRIYVGSDPWGRRVEVSKYRQALDINQAHGTVVRGLGFRHYATTVYAFGAVKGNASRLTFERNTFYNNAAAGLQIFQPDARVLRNRFVGNGQIGLSANRSHNMLVDNNYFSNNNRELFHGASAVGAVKVTGGRHMRWANNVAVNNQGQGLWCDINCYDIEIVRNWMSNNYGNAIQFELSANAIIASNVAISHYRKAGVAVMDSGDVDVYNNTLVRNRNNVRIIDGSRRSYSDPAITWQVSDVRIRNNIFSNGQNDSTALLSVDDITHQRSAESMGVSTDYNAYYRTDDDKPDTLVQWSRWPSYIIMADTLSEFRDRSAQEDHSIIFANTSNPFFVDVGDDDYRLRSSSPAQNAGVGLPYSVARAIGVNDGVRVDLGALHL